MKINSALLFSIFFIQYKIYSVLMFLKIRKMLVWIVHR